jgi:hypothetical protein
MPDPVWKVGTESGCFLLILLRCYAFRLLDGAEVVHASPATQTPVRNELPSSDHPEFEFPSSHCIVDRPNTQRQELSRCLAVIEQSFQVSH